MQNGWVARPATQLVMGIALTIPISEGFTRGARAAFYRAEISRSETLKEREKTELDIESAFEKSSLNEIKNSIDGLNQSLKLLSQARSILVKKFSLNKIGYFELSGLEDRI